MGLPRARDPNVHKEERYLLHFTDCETEVFKRNMTYKDTRLISGRARFQNLCASCTQNHSKSPRLSDSGWNEVSYSKKEKENIELGDVIGIPDGRKE